jgi:hypothetical protein
VIAEAESLQTAFCGGNASPDDVHLAARVVCVDDEIVGWVEQRRRERRKKERAKDAARTD